MTERTGAEHTDNWLMRWVLHPYFVAAYPVIALYATNINLRPFQPSIIPMAIFVGVAAIIVLACKFGLRDSRRGGLIASILFFSCFAYFPLYSEVKGAKLAGLVVGRDLYMFPAWTILTLVALFYAFRARRGLGPTTALLNLIFFFSLALPVMSVVSYTARNFNPDPPVTSDAPYEQLLSEKSGAKRDIYYFVFDRYPGADTLREYYDFDNTAFLDDLRAKGFWVADASHANYTSTSYGLSTSLNMEYLDFMAEKVGKASGDRKPMLSLLREHRVARILKGKGYEYHHIGSFWQPTESNYYADVSYRWAWSNEVWRALMKRTLLYPVYRHTGLFENQIDTYPAVHNSTLQQFENVKRIRDLDKPTFAFAHFLIGGHDPYTFDKNGDFVSRKRQEKIPYRKKFVDQLTYTNSRITEVMDHLLDVPESKKPIIIIQSDEGPYPPNFLGKVNGWPNATDTHLVHKFRILTALHFPGVDTSKIDDRISNVNVFRYLFNFYFGSELEIFDDRQFIQRRLYDFIDVTDRIAAAEKLPASARK